VNAKEILHRYLDDCPLIAIVRGVTPEEAEATAQALYDGGIRIVEVPLNSPAPIESIKRIAAKFGDSMLVGAGTVVDPQLVDGVREAGGGLIVAPNTDARVISTAAAADMVSCPGYFTPSEAFAACNAGATALKLFPAEAATPVVLKALLAVVPKDIPQIIVGGIAPDNMRPWLDAGATGFGLGSGLYKPGQSPGETLEKARSYVAGLRA